MEIYVDPDGLIFRRGEASYSKKYPHRCLSIQLIKTSMRLIKWEPKRENGMPTIEISGFAKALNLEIEHE